MSGLAYIIAQIVLAAWVQRGERNIPAVGAHYGLNHVLFFVVSGDNIEIGFYA